METQTEVLAEAFEAEANQAPTIVDAGVDAPTVKTTNTTDSSKGYTEEDLAKVRSQEKDKLYPQIEKLKSELEEIKQTREAELAAKQAEKEAQDAEERTRLEADLDVRELLKKKETEWSEQLERERQERERAFALLEREKTFAEIQNFRQQRLEEEREAIIPELLDLVTGSTQDEINTSIEGLKDRSTRILESAQQAMQSARKEMTGSRVTAPPTGPLDINSEQRNFTADEISAMPMNEYAKYRQRLLSPKAQGKGSGLFGSS
jgi:DNA repair exonuclease SbcCD ATPase subunit